MTNHKGSLTVEAALVLPIVFFTVLILVYLAIIFYEKATFQAIANEVAREAAMEYKNLGISQRDLYWRIFDTKKGDKISQIKDTIEDKINDDSAIITVDVKNKIFSRELTIDISKDYYLGSTHFMTIHGYSKTSIEDTTEMIRVVDFVDDLAAYIPGYVNAKDKYYEAIDKVISKIDSTFK